MLRRSTGDVKGRLLLPAALHRGWDAHGLTVFGNRATRDVDASMAKLLDDRVVGKNVGRVFTVDQLPDAVTHGFRRMRFAAVGRCDRRRKEVFQLEDAAAG